MKKFLILFAFISGACLAQEPMFNFEKNKAYKIVMKGADNFMKADNIARQTEKLTVAIFSYVDPATSTGYFIVDNFNKVHEIEIVINKVAGFSYLSYEEISLNEELFLELYMKRGGYESIEFSKNKPREIVMGPFVNLTNELYRQALTVWEKAYGNSYNNKLKGLPEHCPEFVNTGNPEKDNINYEKAKQEWIKNYPKEAEQ